MKSKYHSTGKNSFELAACSLFILWKHCFCPDLTGETAALNHFDGSNYCLTPYSTSKENHSLTCIKNAFSQLKAVSRLFFLPWLKNEYTNVHSQRTVYHDWKEVVKNGFLSQPCPLLVPSCFQFPTPFPRDFYSASSFAAQVVSCTGYWKFASKKPSLRAAICWEAFYLYRLLGTASIQTTLAVVSLSLFLTPCFRFSFRKCVCLTLYPRRRRQRAREVRKRRSRWGRCSVIFSVVKRAWAVCATWPADGPVHSGLYITLHLFV